MPAGGDLLQRLRTGGVWSSRSDRRGGTDVHEIDHRDGRVRFGECGGDGRERAWSEPRTADLTRQHQSEQPRPPERVDSIRREPTLLVVLP